MDTARDDNTLDLETTAHEAAAQAAEGPFYWRVASGVLYAEMPLTRSIRPPLLTDWESERVQVFRNRERRTRWLAGRALAKALVKERLGMKGIVEIREGADGEPLVFENGFPRPDVWLGIAVRHGRVTCVLADRPVSLEVRRIEPTEVELVDRFLPRGEQRTLRRALGTAASARSAGWAIKEAAQRATRTRDVRGLGDVSIDAELGVDIGEHRLQVLAVRIVDEVAVAIVGRFRLEERQNVRIVLDDAAREAATPRLQGAIERSMVRARRIAEARMRWQTARPEPT